MRIKIVYEKFGALERSARGRECLRRIQTIAMTNAETDAANKAIRWNLFAESVDNSPQLAVQMLQRASESNDDNLSAQMEAQDEQHRLLATRVMVGDLIFLTKNGRVVYPATANDPEQHEKLFFSSRLLEAMQFYNSPARIIPNTWCRCGLCPEKSADMLPNYMSPCLVRRDLVPPMRRGIDILSEQPLLYHSEGMQYLSSDVCRMGVFRDQAGEYIEFNVTRGLGMAAVPSPTGSYAPYGRGFAMTVHRTQGSQQRIVVFVCSRASKNFSWRAVYTAVTRAQSVLVILSSPERFREFVYRVEPIRRSMLWYHLNIATDALCNRPPNRTIRERWNEFEARRYRTDAAAADDDGGSVEQANKRRRT